VQIGTAKGAKSVLPHLAQSQDQRKTARALEPCAQFEFQSTGGPLSTGLRTASGGCAGEIGLPSAPPARQPYHYEAGQSICADRCPRASRNGPGHIAGHSAADGHQGGGLHSIALSGRANACAFLAMLSPPPLLPTHRPARLV
jgi:hypothetical protein